VLNIKNNVDGFRRDLTTACRFRLSFGFLGPVSRFRKNAVVSRCVWLLVLCSPKCPGEFQVRIQQKFFFGMPTELKQTDVVCV
jgi:hypothetical protein